MTQGLRVTRPNKAASPGEALRKPRAKRKPRVADPMPTWERLARANYSVYASRQEPVQAYWVPHKERVCFRSVALLLKAPAKLPRDAVLLGTYTAHHIGDVCVADTLCHDVREVIAGRI